jgi:hypothetical protein
MRFEGVLLLSALNVAYTGAFLLPPNAVRAGPVQFWGRPQIVQCSPLVLKNIGSSELNEWANEGGHKAKEKGKGVRETAKEWALDAERLVDKTSKDTKKKAKDAGSKVDAEEGWNRVNLKVDDVKEDVRRRARASSAV